MAKVLAVILVAACLCAGWAEVEFPQQKPRHHHHHHHHQRRSHSIICANGTPTNGKCVCSEGFVGEHCEKKMFCRSSLRNRDGSCQGCQPNYEGDFCEAVVCVNGEQDEFDQTCLCRKPYSGEFCNKLTTEDVYLFYNSRMANKIGPLGALSLIPLILFYYGCEYMAQKRNVKRIGRMMSDQTNVAIDNTQLKHLLKE